MNYEDIGYDQYLLRPLKASFTEQIGIDSASAYEQISGSQVRGDIISSLNGNMKIDLQEDRFVVTDGIVDRVELGRLSDGFVGFIIRDSDGNELMRITGDQNIIQSGDKSLSIDFNEAQLLVRNEGQIPVVLIGKQIGGF